MNKVKLRAQISRHGDLLRFWQFSHARAEYFLYIFRLTFFGGGEVHFNVAIRRWYMGQAPCCQYVREFPMG